MPCALSSQHAGRDVLTLPHRTQFDMGLFKTFPIHEDMHFEFRTEAFNVFNHTQWSGINAGACYGAANCPDNGFLTASSAHAVRILQFAGKFVF